MTIESFAQVLDDNRVSDIVILDDLSTDGSYEQLLNHCSYKVRVYQNDRNYDCYRNKQRVVSLAKNEWVIVLDSDNIITPEYLNAIYTISEWNPIVVYQPSFAKPHFDFRKFAGNYYGDFDVRENLHDGAFTTALNAMNFFINRDTYLRAFNPDIDPVTSDSIYMAYRLLEQGNSYYFVPGLEYEHRIHPGSHYQNNVNRTPHNFHQSILEKLAAL